MFDIRAAPAIGMARGSVGHRVQCDLLHRMHPKPPRGFKSVQESHPAHQLPCLDAVQTTDVCDFLPLDSPEGHGDPDPDRVLKMNLAVSSMSRLRQHGGHNGKLSGAGHQSFGTSCKRSILGILASLSDPAKHRWANRSRFSVMRRGDASTLPAGITDIVCAPPEFSCSSTRRYIAGQAPRADLLTARWNTVRSVSAAYTRSLRRGSQTERKGTRVLRWNTRASNPQRQTCPMVMAQAAP